MSGLVVPRLVRLLPALFAAVALAAVHAAPAHAGGFYLRPVTTNTSQWATSPGGGDHATFLAEPVIQPTLPDTTQFYIHENSNGPRTLDVTLASQTLQPGENVVSTQLWTYAQGASNRTVDLSIMSGGSVLSSTSTMPTNAPRAWYTFDGPVTLTQAQLDDLHLRAVLNGSGSTTPAIGYAAYLEVITDLPPVLPTVDSAPVSPGQGRNPTWTFSATDPTVTFECQLTQGATIISDWASCAGSKSLDLSLSPDATYTFAVRTLDTWGYVSDPVTRDYTLDTTAPVTPSITSSPVTPGTTAMPSWSFTAELGASTECRVTGPNGVVSNWGPCGSPASYDISAEPDGLFTFDVRATDAAGNTGTAASSTYAMDRSVPTAPSITSSPATPSTNRSPAWSFTGGGTPTPSYECRLTEGATIVSDWATCASPKSYDLSLAPDGSYLFEVRGRSSAGTLGPATSHTFVLDTTAPVAPSLTSTPTTPGNDPTPTWAFTAEPGAPTECRVTFGATVVSDWTPCTSPDTVDLTAGSDGVYRFAVRATDAAGNVGAVATHDYDMDLTAPVAPTIQTSPASPGTDATPTWDFSAPGGTTTECRLTGPSGYLSDWAACSSPQTYDVSAQLDGAYGFSVRATDAVGNTGPAAGNTYDLDRSVPGQPTITSAPASPSSNRSPTWSFSGGGGASKECRLLRGATVVHDWAICTTPKTYDLTAEPDGTYDFSVRGKSPAQTPGPAAQDTYVLDTTAPAAPSFTTTPSTPGNDATPTWDFTAEAGASTQCRVTRGATIISDWAACASPFTHDLSSQPDATYRVSVRAIDAAGNTGTAGTNDYLLDTAAPAAPVLTGTPVSPGTDATPTWTFTAEAGAAIACRLTGPAGLVSNWASCSSPATFDVTAQPDGAFDLDVRATDPAGNTGAATTHTYALDRSVPTAPAITASPASPGSGRTPAWSFTGSAPSHECRFSQGATVISDWAACVSPRSYDLSLAPDAAYTFDVRGRSSAGTLGPVTTRTYVLDTVAPVVPVVGSGPVSPGTDATPTWTFTAEVGAAVDCRVTGPDGLVSDWTACSSPFTPDLTAEPDGAFTFDVRATDAAGNVGPAHSEGYSLDRFVPTAPVITSAPATPDSDRSVSWSYTGDPGVALECRLDRGATTVSGWTTCTSPTPYDLMSEPDGDYTFSVRGYSTAGTRGPTTTSDYTLDTGAPPAPAFASFPPTPGSTSTPTWDFTIEPGASAECRVSGPNGLVSDWGSCTSPFTPDLTAEPDGSFTVDIRATDPAGNVGPTRTGTYEMDRYVPLQPVITSSPATPGADRSPTWAFQGEPGMFFDCRLDQGATQVYGWTTCTSPRTYDLSLAADGTYTFTVRARNLAGTVSTAAAIDYELDTIAPGAPTFTATPPVISFDPSPSWGFSAEPGAQLDCRMAGPGGLVSDWATCSSPASYDLSSASDGTFTFDVRATDAAGNVGPARTGSYQLDRSVPSAPTITAAPVTPATNRTPVWSFTGEAGVTFECRLDQGATIVSNWTGCASPRSYDLSLAADGAYDFRVRARNAAGTASLVTTSTYVLDTTAPAAPVFTSRPADISNDPTPTWAFTAESGAATQCRVTGPGGGPIGWAPCTSPATFDLTSRPDGDFTIDVRATDGAGNVGAIASDTYTLDRTVPAPPVIDASPVSPASDLTPTWSFTEAPGTTPECRLDRGATAVAAWAPCSSPVTFNLTGQADGTYTASVRGRNVAGTASAAVTSDYELDTTAPVAPAVTPGQGPVGHGTNPSWSFTAEAGAVLQCRLVSGSVVVYDWTSCTSPEAFDLTGQPDATFGVEIHATDAAGNTSAAGRSAYQLDRTSPETPMILGRPGSIGSSRQPAWSFAAQNASRYECRLEGPGGAVQDWTTCGPPYTYDLTGQPDGAYGFWVRAVDSVDNIGPAASDAYRLDTTFDGMRIDSTPPPLGRDRRPVWTFSGEDGASYSCRVARSATTVQDWASCSSPFGADLGDAPDGRYDFTLKAADMAGNPSGEATGTYLLDTTPPAAPTVIQGPGSSGTERSPSWSFDAEAGAVVQCRLEHEGGLVADWTPCLSPQGYDLTGQELGTFRLMLRATDLAGNTGITGESTFELRAPAKEEPVPTPEPPVAPTPTPEPPAPVEKVTKPVLRAMPALTPRPTPKPAKTRSLFAEESNALPQRAAKPPKAKDKSLGETLSSVVGAIAANPDKTVFPLSLIIVIISFLTVQGRIDKRDPKLALAPVFADPELEFPPPPVRLP